MGGMPGMGGGMPGGPPMSVQQQAQQNQADAAAKNEGEKEAAGYKWEQTSKYGESEVLVRFALANAATKKDVKVVFKSKELKVTVAGEELFNSKLNGPTYPDDSTCVQYLQRSHDLRAPCLRLYPLLTVRMWNLFVLSGGASLKRARSFRCCSHFRKMSSGTTW